VTKASAAGFQVVDANGETVALVDAYSYTTVRGPSVGILSFILGPKDSSRTTTTL
jgi:hypothetical protein